MIQSSAESATIDLQSLATLIAASIAAFAAIVGAVVAVINAAKARQWVGRDQWWQRFSWAIEKSISHDKHESELGLSVLIAIIDVPWAKKEDNEMAVAVADLIASRSSDPVHSEPKAKKGWWQR